MRFALLAILFLINSYNVFTQWERVKYPELAPDSFANFNDLLFTSSFAYDVMISKDNGLNWKNSDNGIWNCCVSRVHQYDRYMFAFAQGWYNNGIVFRSADKGESWISLAVDRLPKFVNIRGVNSNSKYLYIGGDYCEGILRSSDFGSTWNSSNTGLPKHSRIYNIVTFDSVVILGVNIDSTDDYYSYYAKNEARSVYKSTNYGNSWKWVST